MTKHVIALTPKMPDTRTFLASLSAGGSDLELTATGDDGVLQLCTSVGRPLVSVEAPLLVHVPGEAERLLGPHVSAPPPPYWWTETRASTSVPEAEALADSVCGRLTTLLGGTVWPRAASTTRVVAIPQEQSADDAREVVASSAPAVPSVDVLTDSTAVVISDRPVLAFTTWLSDVLRSTSATNRALHLVTPPQTRLTLPLRTALRGAPNRWVVQDPAGGYRDGLSGVPLAWQQGTFSPTSTTVADAFTQDTEPTPERQLTLTFRTLHAPTADLILGRGLETAWRHLTGSAPVGWSTAEPVNLPWSPRQLTNLARDRSPAPTHLVAIGAPDQPSIATLRTARTKAGVAQDITLTLGYTSAEHVPLDALASLAATLVDQHSLTTMLTTLRAARSDLTLTPRLEAPPIPVSFTLGPRDVNAIGLTHARRPPLALRPQLLGAQAHPALHYPLGDGTNADAWTAFQHLNAHLKAAPGVQ
ncbi:hypothetical protein F3K20_20215 [Streptomyces scabiei]|uniref:DUF6177 family protein n=1 Tax=Streptomyces scabiei TaxID=1930 RepID=UPI001B305ACA|nr:MULTISPECIES: DUF6177 family protein [Streptomyces]MDX3121575.1 DUF6177 family protein [Streptomyces scabiei]MDX3520379.1 DUF6177 family protein [Streptomyces scabiei]QTU46857.1 hypothetical protein F3K20_20215 [Streptomyces sp. LBUM 1482]